ncbi:zinc finger MYM-type protein 1-like [Photinus pyralis]|uniref:zinc finger MYM-type protein 1-like n=1 Tax=Photinus pyralis TaxID=7054 RepID=UPI0012674B3B|nr:zinc finger MYM-type protein 1-like [Photinus pyralis]
MTEVIRYIKFNDEGPQVCESFLDFFTVSEKTGEGLFESIAEKLKKDGLDLMDCRGQSYDNGANMAGKYKGVQSRIVQENKLAYFVPCSAHSLNLVGVHSTEACVEAQSYFGLINSLYNYFHASTSRWEVLKQHVPLSLKSESKTRWSARIDSVEVIYKHMDKVLSALEELTTHEFSSTETRSEAKSLIKNMKRYEYVVMTCFWYSVLKKIDRVSKFLQREDTTVDNAARNIQVF